jgi:hypothetical protein
MSWFKKEESLNVVVAFVALEVKGEDFDNKWLSMVFKRGNQERIESDRIHYRSIKS